QQRGHGLLLRCSDAWAPGEVGARGDCRGRLASGGGWRRIELQSSRDEMRRGAWRDPQFVHIFFTTIHVVAQIFHVGSPVCRLGSIPKSLYVLGLTKKLHTRCCGEALDIPVTQGAYWAAKRTQCIPGLA